MTALVIEAIRIGCYVRTPNGDSFALDPARIFNGTQLPKTTSSAAFATSTAGSGGHKVPNLILVIVLPIVGFIMLLMCTGCGCFFLIRHRRRMAADRSRSQHLHARW